MSGPDPTLALILGRLAAGTASVALIALIAAAPAMAASTLLSLQGRAYCSALRKFIESLRTRIFLNRGLIPGRRLLLQMTTPEALQILHGGWSDRVHLPRAPINLERRVEA